jgi:hypothetical protein
MSDPETHVLSQIEDDDPDSPWHGIPAELLDGTYSYDVDSAGGCG